MSSMYVHFYFPSLVQSEIDCKFGSVPQHETVDLGDLGFKKSILSHKAIGIVLQVLREKLDICVYQWSWQTHGKCGQVINLNTYVEISTSNLGKFIFRRYRGTVFISFVWGFIHVSKMNVSCSIEYLPKVSEMCMQGEVQQS